jgi:S1-C subfamily serine protease
VTYNVIRAGYFVVSGMQGLKKFYVRGFAKDGEVRGITILYDQAMEGTMDPIVVAMSSAFVPFASYAVASSAEAPQRMVEYGTGLVVSASGHILTTRQLTDGCHVIAIPRLGHAERLAEDSELALLRVYGATPLVPVGLPDAAERAENVTLVGIADPQAQGGGVAVTAVPARLGDKAALDPPPAMGFSGAAALDAEGRLQGVALQKPSIVAGTGGAPQATLVPLDKVKAFLERNHVSLAAGRPGSDAAKEAVVRVICVRK